MPILESRDHTGSLCLYDISKFPKGKINYYSGFSATHVLTYRNNNEDFPQGAEAIALYGDLEKLNLEIVTQNIIKCFDSIMAIAALEIIRDRPPIVFLDEVISMVEKANE